MMLVQSLVPSPESLVLSPFSHFLVLHLKFTQLFRLVFGLFLWALLATVKVARYTQNCFGKGEN